MLCSRCGSSDLQLGSVGTSSAEWLCRNCAQVAKIGSRPVLNCEGYFVLDTGQIASTRGTPRILGTWRSSPKGYHKVQVSLGNRRSRKSLWAHRVVCAAWHGPPPFEGAQVLHLDDCPANNAPDNLWWGDQSLNERLKHETTRPDALVEIHEQMASTLGDPAYQSEAVYGF